MLVRLRDTLYTRDGIYPACTVLDLPASFALTLIVSGSAERLDPLAAAAETTALEHDGETATLPKPRGRKRK